MPENVRYGITITPPDGEPVTGTAVPEWNSASGFALVGQFGVASNLMYASNNPNSYTVNAQASGPSIGLPNGYYYFKIIFDKLDSSITNINISGAVTKSFNVSSIASSVNRQQCMGPPTQYETFEFASSVDGVVNFSITGNSNAYYAITIIIIPGGVPNVLTAANIVRGKNINGIDGTMAAEDATNFIGFIQNGSGTPDSKCLATKNNFTWGQAASNTAISLTQSSPFKYIKGALIGNASATGSFGYTGGSWNGNYGNIDISSINATNINNLQTVNFGANGSGYILKVGRPVIPGYENLKPENIAYGVTITPPGGIPVTGSVIPYSAFKWYSSSYRRSATSFSYDGFYPDGVSSAIYKTGGNDARVTISSTPNPYECLVMAYGHGLSSTISGDYSDSIKSRNNPPAIFKTNITNSGLVFSSSLTSLGVGLTSPIGNELSADVIKEGVTINGITGTMRGATIEESAFAFLDWHGGGYSNGNDNYPSESAGGGHFCTIDVNNESSATFTNFTKNYTNWMVLYRGATNPINFVVNGSSNALTTVQSVGAYGIGKTTSPITSATISNSSPTATAIVVFF